MTTMDSMTGMSDATLVAEAKRLAACERQSTVALIRCLMELDARRLYLGQGCGSLFAYCTRVLRLSEHAAYTRIAAARAATRFPVVLDLLDDGVMTLTSVTVLAPVLSEENHRAAFEEARHKSKREVEVLAARLRPRPDVPASLRKLPDARPSTEPVPLALATAASVGRPFMGRRHESPPSQLDLGLRATASRATGVVTPPAPSQAGNARPIVKPLAPGRYSLKLTISQATQEKLRRAQDLLRHAIPSGDLAAVFDRALTALLRELERTKLAAAAKPRAVPPTGGRSRHIPAAVRREVWQRDGRRCAFIGAEGRCGETAFLEFHHRVPFADGGAAKASNVELRCRPHNMHEAEQWFGPMAVREEGVGEWSVVLTRTNPEM